MKEKHEYICEVCGKSFTNSEKCGIHEVKECGIAITGKFEDYDNHGQQAPVYFFQDEHGNKYYDYQLFEIFEGKKVEIKIIKR